MKRNYHTCVLVILMSSMLLFAGCKSGDKGAPNLVEDIEVGGAEGVITSVSQIYHLFPSPSEMLSIIDITEVPFESELLHPVGEADKYMETKPRTYILGIYMTDLAYAALFGRHEATLDYLETVKGLSEEIRIDEAVDDDMIESARRNVEYLDSLYNISNEAFMNILAYCERNDRSNTVVMMAAAAFTESLYLAVNLIDDYETADIMLQHLADQKFTINNFMTFAEGIGGNDPNVQATINDLKQIKAIYDSIQQGSGEITIKTSEETDEPQPKRLIIGGGGSQSQPSLTREEFDALKTAVFELRTKIIEG